MQSLTLQLLDGPSTPFRGAAAGDLRRLEALKDRERESWGHIQSLAAPDGVRLSDRALYVHGDALQWMSRLPESSLHAIVTDPPYGLTEYDDEQLGKRSAGSGGIWRVPPSYDGAKRSPLPRFTVLSAAEMNELHELFEQVATAALRILVPGGHVFVASNALMSTTCFHAFQLAGFEKRGEIIRQVQTLRGGDRPKGSEDEFPDVCVMPRSCWEPWGIFRKPFTGTVAANLRKWGTGGLRRPESGETLKDLILCSPTRAAERALAPHPSLKPQRFVRQLVRASLPLGIGIVYDPFAGSGSTLAAAHALGYSSVGTDRRAEYVRMGAAAFDGLAAFGRHGPTARELATT